MNIGFDIGGTHVRIGELTEEGIGRIIDFPTPPEPEEALRAFVDAVERLDSTVLRAAGGMPGIIENGAIAGEVPNLPRWNGYPFGPKLAERLHAPVTIINDAELAALGEARYGAGAGKRVVAYFGLGTGIGTCCVIDGTVVPHTSNGAGRADVMTLSDGSWLEDRIGGEALALLYQRPPKDFPPSVWRALTPLLAEGIANALFAWSPDILILGGSLMNESNGFRLAEVQEALAGAHASDTSRVRLAALGDESGLNGARALVP
jgi:predicted NBD/HSP70 family sugar kinase